MDRIDTRRLLHDVSGLATNLVAIGRDNERAAKYEVETVMSRVEDCDQVR